MAVSFWETFQYELGMTHCLLPLGHGLFLEVC
uniref:Uncharacterized protein n=1 Tax=Anguilla anguilla TaxID=7936 RepID=A0A0E9WB23_ANGAN